MNGAMLESGSDALAVSRSLEAFRVGRRLSEAVAQVVRQGRACLAALRADAVNPEKADIGFAAAVAVLNALSSHGGDWLCVRPAPRSGARRCAAADRVFPYPEAESRPATPSPSCFAVSSVSPSTPSSRLRGRADGPLFSLRLSGCHDRPCSGREGAPCRRSGCGRNRRLFSFGRSRGERPGRGLSGPARLSGQGPVLAGFPG